MTRLRSSSFGAAGRAPADKASFGETDYRRTSSSGMALGRRLGLVVTTVLAVLIGGASSAFACPACFGAEETSMIDGAKLGVLVMLGITLSVQGAFAGFFFYLRARAKRVADIELDTEWSELQQGSRPS